MLLGSLALLLNMTIPKQNTPNKQGGSLKLFVESFCKMIQPRHLPDECTCRCCCDLAILSANYLVSELVVSKLVCQLNVCKACGLLVPQTLYC